MEMVYIEFQMHKNATTKKDENFRLTPLKSLAKKILTKVLPEANPDFDNKIDDVEYWLVECEKESGIPQREIGLDRNKNFLMKMPFKENYGYWTDNNLLLEDFKRIFNPSEITKETFEKEWNLYK